MTLQEIEGRIDAARARVREVLGQAKQADGKDQSSYDFSKVTASWLGAEIVGEKDANKKALLVAEQVSKTSAELEDLQKQFETLKAAGAGLDAVAKADREPAQKLQHPGSPETKGQAKTLGEMVTAHPTFELWKKGQARDAQIVLPDISLKTLFQTSAGWAPESLRTGFVAEAITRPIQVIDIVPSGRTGMAAVVYMEETTRTHASAGTQEGAAKPESTFDLTERSKTVKEIADSVPVTEIQLEDVPMVESYLNGRLVFGVRQALDGDIISNGGDTDSITGLLDLGDSGPGSSGGIQLHSIGSESLIDAILGGMTDIRDTGRAVPTHVLVNAGTWEGVRKTRDDSTGAGTGPYLWGPPSEAGPQRMWGLPIVIVDGVDDGEALVGSFESPWITLFERRGVVVQQGWVNNQFRQNQRTLRASGRWALVVYRPYAFCSVEVGT